MPELPEVETTAADLRPQVTGLRIAGTHLLWPGMVAKPDAAEFAARLAGQEIVKVGRRGKYLLFALASGETLICHLRMTGRLRVVAAESAVANGPHVRAWFALSDGRRLVFTDLRKFARMWLVNDAEEVVGKLGLEPLEPEFTAPALTERLARRGSAIKAVLLDQTLVAGLGNIYADEALFRAGIHPLRPANRLSPAELDRLHAAIVAVLRQAVTGRGTTLRDYIPPLGEAGGFQDQLQVYQRTDRPCPNCGEAIRRIKVTQRSTHYCPNCQPPAAREDG